MLHIGAAVKLEVTNARKVLPRGQNFGLGCVCMFTSSRGRELNNFGNRKLSDICSAHAKAHGIINGISCCWQIYLAKENIYDNI
jgi:hypothetical protein